MTDEYASNWTDTGVLRVVKAHEQSNDRCVKTVLRNVFSLEPDKDSCTVPDSRGTLTPTR